MPGTSLLSLLDDIASLLDDVATLTKVATRNTAGVLGDDLALNAEQVAGVAADRELPVVWAVAKGSALNKLWIVPLALLISTVAPWAITPILMVGGAFLCFEGFEKVAHKLLHSRDEDAAEHQAIVKALADPKVDIVEFEKAKIRGAIRTDVILSAEIVVITLGTVAAEPFVTRLGVLALIATLMTVGVYGFVAGIVKLDDAGLALNKRENKAARTVGRGLLLGAPYLMKTLGIVGTIAMFLVGGGIIAHGIPFIHHFAEQATASAGSLGAVVPTVINALVGIVTGGLAVGVLTLGKRVFARKPPPASPA